MPIYYDSSRHLFHLRAKNTSYIMQVIEKGYLAHLYWGKRVREARVPHALRYIDRGFSPNPNKENRP